MNQRNINPTWYGVVWAQHMQDPTITSELKALIAVVATFPRENWKWRSEHLRSLLNWGDDRWQRVMREAKARKFVAVVKVSDGKTIQPEYQWNIDTLQPAPKAGSVHTPENPANGKPVKREIPLHNNEVKTNEVVNGNQSCPPSSDAGEKEKTDPRYKVFIEALHEGYKRGSRGASWEFAWSARDGKQLKSLLKERPTWNLEMFLKCLHNYFASEKVVPGAPPYSYLMALPRYHAGPLNEFGKLLKSTTETIRTVDNPKLYAQQQRDQYLANRAKRASYAS